MPYIVESSCNICGLESNDLVRDHCHKFGHIRGTLCRQCNSWLGLIESPKIKKLKPKIKVWFEKYNSRIVNHLNSDTGYYYGKKNIKTAFLLDSLKTMLNENKEKYNNP